MKYGIKFGTSVVATVCSISSFGSCVNVSANKKFLKSDFFVNLVNSYDDADLKFFNNGIFWKYRPNYDETKDKNELENLRNNKRSVLKKTLEKENGLGTLSKYYAVAKKNLNSNDKIIRKKASYLLEDLEEVLGSEDLRESIEKFLKTDDFEKVMKKVFKASWENIDENKVKDVLKLASWKDLFLKGAPLVSAMENWKSYYGIVRSLYCYYLDRSKLGVHTVFVEINTVFNWFYLCKFRSAFLMDLVSSEEEQRKNDFVVCIHYAKDLLKNNLVTLEEILYCLDALSKNIDGNEGINAIMANINRAREESFGNSVLDYIYELSGNDYAIEGMVFPDIVDEKEPIHVSKNGKMYEVSFANDGEENISNPERAFNLFSGWFFADHAVSSEARANFNYSEILVSSISVTLIEGCIVRNSYHAI